MASAFGGMRAHAVISLRREPSPAIQARWGRSGSLGPGFDPRAAVSSPRSSIAMGVAGSPSGSAALRYTQTRAKTLRLCLKNDRRVGVCVNDHYFEGSRSFL